MGLDMKPVDEVLSDLIETLSDRKILEFLMKDLGDLKQGLRVNELMQENMKNIQRLSRPAELCIPCADRPKLPGPHRLPGPCSHMKPAWDLWRRKFNIPENIQVG